MTSATLRRFAERLHALLREAYDGPSLAQMTLYRLCERLDLITPPDALDTVLFRLVLWADQNGRMVDLVRAVAADRPHVPAAAALAEEMVRAATQPAIAPVPPGGAGPTARLPEELESLIRAYARIRRVLPNGFQRTMMMGEMVARMQALPLEQYDLPGRLHLSASHSERLAAIVALEKRSNATYLRWLAERLAVELPFAAYHAALALLEAARTLPPEHLDEVTEAVQEGEQWLAALPETSDRRATIRETFDVITARTTGRQGTR